MHRHDLAGARRREPHPGQLLVFDEELTAANVIAYFHVHRGAEAGVVGAEDGYAVRCIVVFDAARGHAENRKIESLFRPVYRHCLRTSPDSVTYESFNSTKELRLEWWTETGDESNGPPISA